ncbi:hypothetical protein LCGC14_1117780 [marine sediment metagenome]|uniref:Uncharacterized protein n=1 Tax=marine sediment metagenome TaxID=412755 RepID=A0A0F9MSR3_9ZZZZ
MKNNYDMVKKGRFKLLSYIIEGHLIFYKSHSKNEKFIAFAIIEINFFNPIISLLNEFLKKKLIHYYSIQLNTFEKDKKEILLNFEDSKKERIIKVFNIIHQKLIETKIQIQFLNEKILEARFITQIFEDIKSTLSIINKSESVLITNNKDVKFLDFYRINLGIVKNKSSFIYNFLNLITSFKRKGYLIFNFKISLNNDVKLNSYFVEFRKNFEENLNIKKNVNNFFNFNLLEKQPIKIKAIFNFLWRLGITDDVFSLNNFQSLFINNDKNCTLSLLEFNSHLEQNLLNNQIKFIRLNKNLLLIEQSFLFLVLKKLDSLYILRIIEKYHSKYLIYITILHDLGYKKLLEISTINQVENIKILHPNKFQELNYKVFKNKII